MDKMGKVRGRSQEKPQMGSMISGEGVLFMLKCLLFVLCADRRAAVAACGAAVQVQFTGEGSEYRDYCHIHSGDFFSRIAGREAGRQQEICMGAVNGRPVFRGIGVSFFGGKPECGRCGY